MAGRVKKAVPKDFLLKKHLTRKNILTVVLTFFVLLSVYFGTNKIILTRAMVDAEGFIEKRWYALASARLMPFKEELVKTRAGCKVIVQANFSLGFAKELAWVSQSCLNNQVRVPDAYMGLAYAREMQGDLIGSLNALRRAATRFPSIPEPHFQMARILSGQNDSRGAVAAYLEASKRAPANHNISLSALEYFMSIGHYKGAIQMASLLKGSGIKDPELKLKMARAYKLGGDPQSAGQLVGEYRELVKNENEAVDRYFRDQYKDLFK